MHSEIREIESVPTDENLTAVGLIDRAQSIRLEGSLKAAPTRRAKRRATEIVIAEQGDEEDTSICSRVLR